MVSLICIGCFGKGIIAGVAGFAGVLAVAILLVGAFFVRIELLTEQEKGN